eukprot:TRINITY_DN1389_c0_g1_i4.p1 TRINITY_DN1389_c0_g1~~TRINITY_DN1389_c0_g1_i4.p1  ORF type:complete len:2183 (+),score=585.91 TRINITY_DN1389_c0_g1_i4:415-6963(+)
MVGYPESLTDPSYRGQILVLTFPLIGNYGVPDPDAVDSHGILRWVESARIHVAALVIANYTPEPSHWNSVMSLGDYLKKFNVPAIHSVDTRALTKRLREQGSTLAKVLVGPNPEDIPFTDPNKVNLVAQVSVPQPITYNPNGDVHITVVDCGLKLNQLRCLVKRGAKVTVVPWNYDFTQDKMDALFLSNGPGDPSNVQETIARISTVINSRDIPVFGICLGHQLLALAAGCQTKKMKFGHRGHNQPCIESSSERCFITSQNHGFVVDDDRLDEHWQPWFTNANDHTNAGIVHKSKPFFSVQFHPEACAGPQDTEFLFDVFMDCIRQPGTLPLSHVPKYIKQVDPRLTTPASNPHKVLILGSGGLSIGQAGEFDYSGSQAIKALKGEGVRTVLVNPNIATVQTSKGLADMVYFLPVTPSEVTKVIQEERPDGILLSFGGQTALNCGVALHKSGVLDKYNVRVLGTPVEAIMMTEDRKAFAEALDSIGEQAGRAKTVSSVEEAVARGNEMGYPVMVRSSYALGGLGSGFANDASELARLVGTTLESAPDCTVEPSVRGWKEVEYEIVRDAYDNCIAVCNMENFDPLGIHTGESIVVAPSQTLSDDEYNMLRTASIKIVRHIGVVGECNVQFSLHPTSRDYFVIEVNARLSRSSALASKATGYPLAFVAAKLALGHNLYKIKNSVTQTTTACFEPSLDYLVVKAPRWDLHKFPGVDSEIGSAMKSVGEVMAIGRTFEEAIQKALRMVNSDSEGFTPGLRPGSKDDVARASDTRVFSLATALAQGVSIEDLHQWSKIDRWFLRKLDHIISHRSVLESLPPDNSALPALRRAKELGFSDVQIAACMNSNELHIRSLRIEHRIFPVVKQIDTVAAEYPAATNYLYLTYHGTEHDVTLDSEAIIVLGSGVYRIGSSVEFDWCAVECVRELRRLGHKTIMVNHNPETVSTDYDECDRLYFDEINLEVVLDIYRKEKSSGVVVAVGGQIANNLAMGLHRQNVTILGTSATSIDNAENRYKFSRLLDQEGIDQPKWSELSDVSEALKFCHSVGYPVLVRPSYVLSGAAMRVVHSEKDLESDLTNAARVSPDHPVVISKFILGAKEIEIDAIARNGHIISYAISEHVENAGVHSGDATLVLPAQDLTDKTKQGIVDIAAKIAKALYINGPFNMQVMAKDDQLKVIECNLRVSRSFPFASKVLGRNLITLATQIFLGLPVPVQPSTMPNHIGVKVPQFSFHRLQGADATMGVEMMSTGEVACFGENKYEAYLKALVSTGFVMPKKHILLSIGSYGAKQEFLPFARKLHKLGFVLHGSEGTADFYGDNGIPIHTVSFPYEAEHEVLNINEYLSADVDEIDLVINIPMKNKVSRPASYVSQGTKIRKGAIQRGVPLITDIKCAKFFVEAISISPTLPPIKICDRLNSSTIVLLPGLIDVHVHMREPGQTHKEDWYSGSAAALAGGITCVLAMPNTHPEIIDGDTLALALELAEQKAVCDFGHYLGASKSNAATLPSAAGNACGLKMYLNETFTTLMIANDVETWHEHFEHWPHDKPIVVHAECQSLAAILLLAHLYDRHVHVAHVARKAEIITIVKAKKRGINVTCEAAPHHLFMTQEDADRLGGRGQVRPCLVRAEDREALWANIEYIDCIATDHAPHTVSEKDSDRAPPGFPGLETSLALMLTMVKQGRLSLQDVVDKMCHNPRRIFNIPEQPDTHIEVDLDAEWEIPASPRHSKAQWSPFTGTKVSGLVRKVRLRGQVVYSDGQVLAEPGYGTNLFGQRAPRTSVVDSPSLPRQHHHAVSAGSGARESRGSVSALEEAALDAITKPHPSSSSGLEAGVNVVSSAVAPSIDSAGRGWIIGNDTAPVASVGAATLHKSRSNVARSILSVRQFEREDLRTIFNIAHQMRDYVERQGGIDILKGRVMGSIFYEPSTRTSCSFQAAMQRLGGTVLSMTDMSTSSVVKGETLEDFIKVMQGYCDIVVLRHPQQGAATRAAKVASVPIINAGDGVGEHPTQALLDVFTIREEMGTVNGLTVTMVGDLKHGRTVHSLSKLLMCYRVRLIFVSPPSLSMPEDVLTLLRDNNVPYKVEQTLEAVLEETDVMYVTRVQKERFADPQQYEAIKDHYIVTPAIMRKVKQSAILMHPLPRVNEIHPDVDTDPRAAYFRQAQYGMYVRMALLAQCLDRVPTASVVEDH